MKRKPNENSEQLLRRFLRTIQEENILVEAKEKMFRVKKPNKRALKESLLNYLEFQARKQKELRGY